MAVAIKSGKLNFDSAFAKLPADAKQSVIKRAADNAQAATTDLTFKADYAAYLNRSERLHQIEAINKVTLSLSCLIFFFIGAPLGAIIRKGGLGIPVLVSVLVFIVYFILENTGMKMARDDNWTVWFGKLLGTAVLTPVAAFFTYKANNDSVVFNIDLYKSMFMRLLGLRAKRHISSKEVIIEDPDYLNDARQLLDINQEVRQYNADHRLLRLPNPIKVFFRPGDDHNIERIIGREDGLIRDLMNTRDRAIITYLNRLPIVATHAHTRPFRRKWLNAITGLFIPAGLVLYLRMCRFRFRLYKDLVAITQNNELIARRIAEMTKTDFNSLYIIRCNPEEETHDYGNTPG